MRVVPAKRPSPSTATGTHDWNRAPPWMPKSASKRTVLESAFSLRTIAPIPIEDDSSDTLERAARAELAALDPALFEDDAWNAARDNLLRLFALLQEFTEAEVEVVDESDICPARSGKIG